MPSGKDTSDDEEGTFGFDADGTIPEAGVVKTESIQALSKRKKNQPSINNKPRRETLTRNETAASKLPTLGKSTKGCKAARSRVVLKQRNDQLNLKGNFTSDVFNSAIDEATGLLTMVTVYSKKAAYASIFWAAVGIYSFNVLLRLLIGLNELLNPPIDKDGRQMMKL